MTYFKDEDKGKELYRYAHAYAQKHDQQVKLLRGNIPGLFDLDLVNLRNKVLRKCEEILYLSCSKRRNSEELLWKCVIYSVISQCKQHKSILDPSHVCHYNYSNHLMNATVYYQQLLHNLQDHYGIQVTKMNIQQLEDLETTSHDPDSLWVKEASQRCFICLGDIARYQIDLGYSSDHSLSFYQQAIGLDPSNGSPYNQLAALSELLQQPFEAMYYYLRSMSAQKPFQGVEKNIERLLKKNESLLTDLESRQTSITELELPQFNLNLLLCKFLQLQSVFLKSSMNPTKEHTTNVSSSSLSTTDINNLCSAIVSLLEDCLTRDFHKFISNHSETAADNGKDSPLLNDSILLKISALTILPAYNLRLQGSKDTLSACAFSFAVLSLLLLSAHKRLICRTMMLTQHKDLPVDELHSLVINVMSAGTSMMELLNRGATPTGTAPVGVASITQTRGQDGGGKMKKKEKIKLLDKRRRRRKPNNGSSSEEEEDDVKISLSHSSLSSLDDDIGEDDLDMIDSFSNSSLDDDEQSLGQPLPLLQESTVAAELDQKAPGKIKGKKKFVLAATFSLVKQENSTNDLTITNTTANEPSIIDPLTADIAKLQIDTELQRTIHLACSSVVSQEYHLQAIKVLIDWIQSYPAVLATYGKSTATNIWSRLADLLNYLPCERDLHKSGFIETHSCAGWTQTQPVLEDKHLRGFPPLLRIHQSLDHSTANADDLQQALTRIQCLMKFGHYLASSKTIPSMEYDHAKGVFVGPAQRDREEKRSNELQQQKIAEEAQNNRSKLMKVMAQKRLQSEVVELTKAGVSHQRSVFTPYLLPDAPTFCHSLHLVKRLMKSQKFVIIVAKSMIESLDLMKKEKNNFAARDAIKFLEKELKSGNQFLKAQNSHETFNPNRKKPHKLDLSLWLFDGLIDCAIHFNSSSSTTLSTLLLDKQVVTAFQKGQVDDAVDPYVLDLLTNAQQHGIQIESMMKFYRRWQKDDSRRN